MLFNNVLNSIFALAIMALDILVYVQHADKHYSLIGLIIDSALLYACQPRKIMCLLYV